MHRNSVVVISGGSRGLGAALVARCLELGCKVATFSRSESAFIKSQIEKDPVGENFFWQSLDVQKEGELKNFLRAVNQRFGRVDGLVNNVGVGVDGVLALTPISEVHKCIDFNLKSTIFLTQLCSKTMLKQRSGSIVNISSVNAIRGHFGVSVYSATKAALDGFTRSLAQELGRENIRVNSIAPGYFESDMVQELTEEQKNRIKRRTPLNRLAKIEEIVNGVMFMLSSESSFITGQTLVIDGGITC